MIKLLRKLAKAWTLITNPESYPCMGLPEEPIERGHLGSTFTTCLPEDRISVSFSEDGPLKNLKDATAVVRWNIKAQYNRSGIVNLSLDIERIQVFKGEKMNLLWDSKENEYVLEDTWYSNQSIRPYALNFDLDNEVATVEFLSEM
jgi:hypothetical protein